MKMYTMYKNFYSVLKQNFLTFYVYCCYHVLFEITFVKEKRFLIFNVFLLCKSEDIKYLLFIDHNNWCVNDRGNHSNEERTKR